MPALVVGLTGGIGSGKSTVSARLAARGATVIDADQLTREVQKPDGPAFAPIVTRFGPGVVAADGTLDRPALAAMVFGDAGALADLNAIVWPLVGAEMARRLAEAVAADDDGVVVLDIPLLVEGTQGKTMVSKVIVVDCPEDVAVARLVEFRGMDEADARARIARQASRADRLALADFVIDNAGPVDALEAEVDRCWVWLITNLRRNPAQDGPDSVAGS